MASAKDFAFLLNGREYRDEVTEKEVELAKGQGIVIVFGASDDLCEFRGAIDGEVDCYGGTTIYFDEDGIIGTCDNDDFCEKKSKCVFFKKAIEGKASIQAVWSEGGNMPCWSYKANFPHAQFSIMDDEELYCRGIVFSINRRDVWIE